jgi:hypothetical protein
MRKFAVMNDKTEIEVLREDSTYYYGRTHTYNGTYTNKKIGRFIGCRVLKKNIEWTKFVHGDTDEEVWAKAAK